MNENIKNLKLDILRELYRIYGVKNGGDRKDIEEMSSLLIQLYDKDSGDRSVINNEYLSLAIKDMNAEDRAKAYLSIIKEDNRFYRLLMDTYYDMEIAYKNNDTCGFAFNFIKICENLMNSILSRIFPSPVTAEDLEAFLTLPDGRYSEEIAETIRYYQEDCHRNKYYKELYKIATIGSKFSIFMLCRLKSGASLDYKHYYGMFSELKKIRNKNYAHIDDDKSRSGCNMTDLFCAAYAILAELKRGYYMKFEAEGAVDKQTGRVTMSKSIRPRPGQGS